MNLISRYMRATDPKNGVPRYCLLKTLEGIALGFILCWPFWSDNGLAWNIACSVIVGFGVDFLCEKF